MTQPQFAKKIREKFPAAEGNDTYNAMLIMERIECAANCLDDCEDRVATIAHPNLRAALEKRIEEFRLRNPL